MITNEQTRRVLKDIEAFPPLHAMTPDEIRKVVVANINGRAIPRRSSSYRSRQSLPLDNLTLFYTESRSLFHRINNNRALNPSALH